MYAYCLAKTVNKRKRVKLENDENDLKDLLIGYLDFMWLRRRSLDFLSLCLIFTQTYNSTNNNAVNLLKALNCLALKALSQRV